MHSYARRGEKSQTKKKTAIRQGRRRHSNPAVVFDSEGPQQCDAVNETSFKKKSFLKRL